MPAPARSQEPGPWPPERAAAWAREHPWLVGCNYIPSTAINQLEMWQADTFDPATIDRELGWAEGLGFNSVRVFLHDLLWEQDAPGFLARMDQFLAIADRHKIGVVFVLFDAVWDPAPKLGQAARPEAGPAQLGVGAEPRRADPRRPARHDALKPYVAGVVGRFKADRRVHAWDLFNEPDNTNRSSYGRLEPAGKPELALALLEKTFAWAREANPSQPLTAGVWQGNLSDPDKLSPINRYMLTQSDVISFHNYRPLAELKKDVEALKRYRRPMLCTEYMARPVGQHDSTRSCAYLKEEQIGAYNWGFVAGKSQTIYPWDSWQKPYAAEPPVWFHDIFRPDGTPYNAEEVAFIRRVTGKAAPGRQLGHDPRHPPADRRRTSPSWGVSWPSDSTPIRTPTSPRPKCCAGSTWMPAHDPGGRASRRAGTTSGQCDQEGGRASRRAGIGAGSDGASPSRRAGDDGSDPTWPSYIARTGRIVGHLGLCRTAFEGKALAAAGGRVSTIHIIDWLGSPEHRAVGMSLMRRAHQGVGDAVRPGGQPGGAGGRRAGGLRAAEPGAGLHPCPPRGYWLRAGAPSPWQRGLRLARDAASRLMGPPGEVSAVDPRARRGLGLRARDHPDRRAGQGARDPDDPRPGAAQRSSSTSPASRCRAGTCSTTPAGSAVSPCSTSSPRTAGAPAPARSSTACSTTSTCDLWHAAFVALTGELKRQGADLAQAYASTPWAAEALRPQRVSPRGSR